MPFVHAVQLLSDEYGSMSPGSLEAQGLISASEYQKVAALTQSVSPDAHKKIAGTVSLPAKKQRKKNKKITQTRKKIINKMEHRKK